MKKLLILLFLTLTLLSQTKIENNLLDLQTFTQIIQQELNLNVILSQDIQDKDIYFYLSKDIKKTELLDIFKRALQSKGLNFEKRDNYVFVTLATDEDIKLRFIKVNPLIDKKNVIDSLESISSNKQNSSNSKSVNNKFTFIDDFLVFKSDFNTYKDIDTLVNLLNSTFTKIRKKQFLYKIRIIETNRNRAKTFDSGIIFNTETNSKISFLQNSFDGFLSLLTGSTGFIPKSENIDIFLKILNENGITKILSNPEISIQLGESATLQVGGTVRVTNLVEKDEKGNDKKTKQEKDIGLILTIEPTEYYEKFVTTKIELNVENIQSYDSDGEPLTSKKSINTIIDIEDNTTVALGGLFETTISNETRKVPLLGDLPILNYVFSAEIEKSETKVLNILLTVEELK